MRLVTALFAALVLTLISSCSTTPQQQQTELPDGKRLLADSAAAMRTVKSVHFTIAAQGDTPGISVRYADGQITQQGSAKGTAKVDQGGKLVDQEFVIIGSTLYLRGPGGDYQKLPSSVTGAAYDPSAILSPDRGIAAVLASGKDAKTEAREPLAGIDTYRLAVTFPKQPLGQLLPGISDDTKSQVWLAVQGLRLVEAQFRVGRGLVSVHFTDYDTPVTINSPV